MESRSRLVLLLSSFLIFVLLGGFFSSSLGLSGAALPGGDFAARRSKSFRAPRPNVWAELTETEASTIFNFLVDEFDDLNLTTHPKSGTDNFVYQLEVLRPNKTATVPFLFEEAPIPERWAKVVINEYKENYARLVYYSVGPLGASHMQLLPLEYPFNSGKNWVYNMMTDFASSNSYSTLVAENMSDITQELLGAKVDRSNPDNPDGLTAFPRPTKLEGGGLLLWIQFFRPGLGSAGRTLLPNGIYVKVNATSPNVNEWIVGECYYNGKLYDSVDDFRAAIKKPGFVKTPPNRDGAWTDTEDFDSHGQGRELPPPISVQPYGPRYKLDIEHRYVSWFGFGFYFTTGIAQGIILHDVRFKGERVAYELSLQEAMAHYAGDDPMNGGQEFFDSFFGMGSNMFELIPGYDCPAYADFFDTQMHRTYKTHTSPNSICLFEFTSDYLMSRHTAQYSITASKNTFLTLRSVSTVGNYDYMIDYIFFMDGTFEVKVRASGYIYGAFYTTNTDKNEDEYGHRVHTALSTSMHDHVINFKADLDVAGSKNDMVRLAVEPITKTYPWDKVSGIKQRNTMHLVEKPVTHEIGLDWPKNGQELYIVYSSDQKNVWGERKGYRVTSGTGMGNTPHLAIINSTTLGNAARWAEHDIWVVQHKDTEPRSGDPLSYLEPLDPLIDFSKIANHESLEHDGPDKNYDGDLVLYFNVGSHHIPHSGDIPNTLMHTSATSVMFVPHNFNDRDPSRESVQGVRLQLKGTKSGGFAGFEPDEGGLSANDDLRAREDGKDKVHKLHKGANYFGTPYHEGMKLSLDAFEPDIEKQFRSTEIRVSDLSFNGSAAGTWVRD